MGCEATSQGCRYARLDDDHHPRRDLRIRCVLVASEKKKLKLSVSVSRCLGAPGRVAGELPVSCTCRLTAGGVPQAQLAATPLYVEYSTPAVIRQVAG